MDLEHLIARKDDHIDIALQQTTQPALSNSFDAIQFEHCALPELSLDQIDLRSSMFGRTLNAPLLISSMTGGPRRAERINRHLTEAAEELGIALAVGSQRVALETTTNFGLDRVMRRYAPSIPLLANLGAAQLVKGYGVDEAMQAVDMIEADALIIHLNPLQEAVQPEGDRDWRNVLHAIEWLVIQLPVPVVIKEVGYGLSVPVIKRLRNAGVSIIDIAGAGGTRWTEIEAHRARTPQQRAIAMAFSQWGIPTAQALHEAHQAFPDLPLIASGGIRDGIDAAKALRLGAQWVGQAGATLESALTSTEAVVDHFKVLIEQLRIACFCTGSADLQELRRARLRG